MSTQSVGQLAPAGRSRDRSRPYVRSLLISTLIIVVGFLAGSGSPAQAAPLDQTCADNTCRKVEWINGELRSLVTTSVNRGTYHEVCLRRKSQDQFTCKFFEFRQVVGVGTWYSNISLQVHFPTLIRGPGNFLIAWRSLGWPIGGRHLEFSKK